MLNRVRVHTGHRSARGQTHRTLGECWFSIGFTRDSLQNRLCPTGGDRSRIRLLLFSGQAGNGDLLHFTRFFEGFQSIISFSHQLYPPRFPRNADFASFTRFFEGILLIISFSHYWCLLIVNTSFQTSPGALICIICIILPVMSPHNRLIPRRAKRAEKSVILFGG